MPQQPSVGIENSFIAGLKTEFTGLNFPQHAATDTDNCIYDLVGDVTRREGFDYEDNFHLNQIDRTNKAISTYKWNNVGGDGLTQLIVNQIGSTLYFYSVTNSTIASPLSNNRLISTVDLTFAIPTTSTFSPVTVECQYADGNGYLFVFNSSTEPVFCTYNPASSTVTAAIITVQIRDFLGIPELGLPDNQRPSNLSNEHLYNLRNQGWGSGANWTAASTTPGVTMTLGSHTWTVQTGITAIASGQQVSLQGYNSFGYSAYGYAIVTSYNSGTGSLTLNITYSSDPNLSAVFTLWYFQSATNDHIGNWNTQIGNYPSNADVWWRFKDSSGVYNPSTTINNVSIGSGPAPKGSYILNAFNQSRTGASNVVGLTDIKTNVRSKTGCWFQGRVWYAGTDASQQATGDAQYYSWSENIYFSQIIVSQQDFGKCYQTNDPTDENLFDLLPTDGGVIQIQGCGSVYKLFPIQNGLLVFAANGIWFITGSQGIGFSANDYTITKISQVQSISSNTFVNVQGLPIFWNEEGIYTLSPAQQGLGLTVDPITVGTILSFYNSIPVQSKKYARGDYNPIDYIVQWCYRSTNETGITSRYEFDRILNYNTYNKAFYPYTISAPIETNPHIHGVNYVAGPGGSTSPEPVFKYLTSTTVGINYNFTFSEEINTDFVDWQSTDGIGLNYSSFFITGYRLTGKALTKFQSVYLQMFSRTNDAASGYKIQGIWDYANSRNSGRYSTIQRVINGLTRFGMVYRRHKIRGSGISLQIKVISVDGLPFDIIGWSSLDTANASV